MTKRSRVHPPYKTKYRVENWAEYDEALAMGGSLTFWLSPRAFKEWKARPTGHRGAQPRYSDLAIETALTLRMAFGLPHRQTEGFLRSIFLFLGVDLEVPDHTTLSRRSKSIKIKPFRMPTWGPLMLILDSTGLSITGEGQWAAAKHGERGARGWRKLHLAIDATGQICHHELDTSTSDDAQHGVNAIDALDDDEIRYVIADAAYDSRGLHHAVECRGARAVIPPKKTASLAKARSPSRRHALRVIAREGRQAWKARSGYTNQSRVENTIGRFKAIFGDRLRARTMDAQRTEAALGVKMLNRMLGVRPPESVAVGR